MLVGMIRVLFVQFIDLVAAIEGRCCSVSLHFHDSASPEGEINPHLYYVEYLLTPDLRQSKEFAILYKLYRQITRYIKEQGRGLAGLVLKHCYVTSMVAPIFWYG